MTRPAFPKRARTLKPGATMTGAHFWALCQIARTSEPGRTAAKMVLVDAKSVTEAVEATGVLQPSVSRLTARLRRAHELMMEAYR